MQTLSLETTSGHALRPRWGLETALHVQQLAASHAAEVLDFLSARPIHTVFLQSFIKENGFVHDLNRGRFYACRNGEGQLLGVALLGHITLIETHFTTAIRAFAMQARGLPSIYMVLGEQETVRRFWEAYATPVDEPRQKRQEILFVQNAPPPVEESVPELRLATPEDLHHLLPLYAEMHRQESGINPLEVDAGGFSRRWLRRLKKNKVWVWTRGERLIFNADVMCETADCIYLEGIYVSPDMRGRGYGSRCMSQLSHLLLTRARSLCLLSDTTHTAAHRFYQKAGYRVAGLYETLFMNWKN